MTAAAAAVFEEAEQHLRAGDYQQALSAYLRVLRGVPDYWRARFRVGDTLLNLKAPHQALAVYNAVAWHAIKAGHPLEALIAIKMAAAMDPAQLEVADVIAELYCKGSERIAAGAAEPTRKQLSPGDVAGDTADVPPEKLIDIAAREAADTSAVSDYPQELPPIPLFSFLEPDAFVSVLSNLNLRRYVKGQTIIQQGQAGDAFYILVEGDVQVSRDTNGKQLKLARLHHGAVFGEMALITNAPRTATVTALADCDVLELKRSDLQAQAHQLASVTQALREFTQQRFLNNLTATNPIFKPLPRSIRIEIIKKFQNFPVDMGDELIVEGEQGQGLFLILKGEVSVSKRDGDETVALATLREGDVFGEISLLEESPTTATCTAKTRGELLFLPKREFRSIMARHPEMRDALAKLSAERLKHTEDVLNPDEFILIEEDDLILL